MLEAHCHCNNTVCYSFPICGTFQLSFGHNPCMPCKFWPNIYRIQIDSCVLLLLAILVFLFCYCVMFHQRLRPMFLHELQGEVLTCIKVVGCNIIPATEIRFHCNDMTSDHMHSKRVNSLLIFEIRLHT